MFACQDNPNICQQLLPLTFTRPVSDLRIGILTIADKWKKYLKDGQVVCLCETSTHQPTNEPAYPLLCIGSHFLPDVQVAKAIKKLKPGEALFSSEGEKIAFFKQSATDTEPTRKTAYHEPIGSIHFCWDIFKQNAAEIQKDFDLLTANRQSAPITDPHTKTYNPQRIFIEPGATIRAATINADTGPVYIGADADIQEGSTIRGPFALGQGAVVNMGSKIRGGTTIGPYCKVGGEISNSVLWGYSNKGHEGFLGNSVLGAWCNLGADTNTSNLKNTYGTVRTWNYQEQDFIDSGQQFLGLVMGDHSKAGINTMFNTGTVAGVGVNVFGGGFPPKHILSFSWLDVNGEVSRQQLDFFLKAENRMMSRRQQEITPDYEQLLTNLYEKLG